MLKIGDVRVFYWEKNRDMEAERLEKLGYRIEKYKGLTNYFLKVLDVPQ